MLRSPVRAAVAIVFLGLVGWTLQTLFHTGFFTIVAVLLLWSQVAVFFLPTKYTLTSETVTVKGIVSKKEKDWDEFRSYYTDPNGLLLSPFVERSRLEKFRGVSLQFHGNRDEVISFVETIMRPRLRGDTDVGDAGQGARGGEAGRAP